MARSRAVSGFSASRVHQERAEYGPLKGRFGLFGVPQGVAILGAGDTCIQTDAVPTYRPATMGIVPGFRSVSERPARRRLAYCGRPRRDQGRLLIHRDSRAERGYPDG